MEEKHEPPNYTTTQGNFKNIKEISVGQMVKIVTDEATIFVNMDKVNFFVEPHNVPPEKSFKSITKNKEGK
ncbi:MAG: hypothetical protein ACE5H1_00300 [Thermodesulfobacteriota bacterium]